MEISKETHTHTNAKTLTSTIKSLVDKLCCWVKVDAHIKRGGVMSLYAMISDVHTRVELCPTSPLALGTV